MSDLLQVTLGVNTANAAAIALYKSVGFEPFGLERGFMRVDGVLHDELHMVLSIAKLGESAAPRSRV
jgi:RimJ/RimL family protein N-acetyltransferase